MNGCLLWVNEYFIMSLMTKQPAIQPLSFVRDLGDNTYHYQAKDQGRLTSAPVYVINMNDSTAHLVESWPSKLEWRVLDYIRW